MYTNTYLLKLSSNMAAHQTARHNIVANNIANVNTPDYKAKDIVPFSKIYNVQTLSPSLNRPSPDRLVVEDRTASEKPNGNSVSIEEQMVLSAQIQNDHALAVSIYKKGMSMMRMTLGKNL